MVFGMMRNFVKCPTCGEFFVPYKDKKHCSYGCYLNSYLFPRKKITVQDVMSCKGLTIKDAAELLDVSYPQLRRKIRKANLREYFPNRGEGRWLSERGYA